MPVCLPVGEARRLLVYAVRARGEARRRGGEAGARRRSGGGGLRLPPGRDHAREGLYPLYHPHTHFSLHGLCLFASSSRGRGKRDSSQKIFGATRGLGMVVAWVYTEALRRDWA